MNSLSICRCHHSCQRIRSPFDHHGRPPAPGPDFARPGGAPFVRAASAHPVCPPSAGAYRSIPAADSYRHPRPPTAPDRRDSEITPMGPPDLITAPPHRHPHPHCPQPTPHPSPRGLRSHTSTRADSRHRSHAGATRDGHHAPHAGRPLRQRSTPHARFRPLGRGRPLAHSTQYSMYSTPETRSWPAKSRTPSTGPALHTRHGTTDPEPRAEPTPRPTSQPTANLSELLPYRRFTRSVP